MAAARPLLLAPGLQRYAWGDPTFIPELLGVKPDGSPCAEAWFGAHPVAPAELEGHPEGWRLSDYLQAHPRAVLGANVDERFGALPFLLKVLAAARPLSIQVHPTAEQAERGFAREEELGIPLDAPDRCYRDRSHKPEALVALTRFHALCGFRTPMQIQSQLEALPELQVVLPRFEPSASGLRALLSTYFDQPKDEVEASLTALIDRLAAADAESPFTEDQREHWALRAHRELSPGGPPDRGLLFVFLLELVTLEPGDAMFLPSGVPHSYLHGAAVELMASSDNVLRAGLTSKHVDPDELMRVVRFDSGRPPILRPIRDRDGEEATYPLPAAEIELGLLDLAETRPLTRQARGPEILLPLPGDATDVTTVVVDDERVEVPRGRACLVPAGITYTLEATRRVPVFRARVPGGEAAADFRGREPTRLAFGTSGLRGLVSDITDLEAYSNTRGFLDFLISTGEAVPGTAVAVGGDLRPSTDGEDRSILRAVARAIDDSGLRPVHCGRIPTPALTSFGIANGWPSIMVTGSHIPFDRNGIKFNKRSGEISKADEAPILESVERRRASEYGRAEDQSLFDDEGWFRAGARPELPPVSDEARRAYVDRYVGALAAGALSGLRVLVYEHSAVGREVLAEILAALGADVIATGRSESFVAIDTEAISDDELRDLQALADRERERHGPFDVIASTDGDSDRPFVLTVDAEGTLRFVGGDVLGAIVARELGADSIAVPISASDIVDAVFEDTNVPIIRTRIGSPHVIRAMSTMEGDRRVGFEANGGFLTGSPLELDEGTLPALPTRDAVLPIVIFLLASQRRGVRPDALLADLPRRFARSGLMDEVAPAESRMLIELCAPGDPRVRAVEYDEEGEASWVDRVGGRYAATGAFEAQFRGLKATLESVFSSDSGFGPLVHVDFLDGVRARFANGDVAHVRPSGNAPQLRIYAVANSEERAGAIVNAALAEPDGALRRLLTAARDARFVADIRRNVEASAVLFASGIPPGAIGTVCGSEGARGYWQRWLDDVRAELRARTAVSFHEDLPVNQAFGLLLLWHRLRRSVLPGEGALFAFVFGDGTRAAPLTEAECGQKPAIASFVAHGFGSDRRLLSTVELALRYFAPVERYLRRSGFDGLVVKWGDEIQIPTLDLTGSDRRFEAADVVRFVSMREMTEDDAASKDWVGVDDLGRVTAFIPRRPLAQMRALADRGLLQRRDGALWGGINLGSIGVSRALLDALLSEFEADVLDPTADRKTRPDLDPQLFTALTIAARPDPAERARAWERAQDESSALRGLATQMPDVLERLRRALDRFELEHGRPIKMVAMDFGDQYWGDIGQHRRMYELFSALRKSEVSGRVARSLAGLDDRVDADGNRIVGACRLGPNVDVKGSVLIDVHVQTGRIRDSVLIGTYCRHLDATDAFDVESTADELCLESGSGTYKIVSTDPVRAEAGERVTTVFLPDGPVMARVHEDTDLRNRAETYDVPILDNEHSFRALHEMVGSVDPSELEAQRDRARANVQRALEEPTAD